MIEQPEPLENGDDLFRPLPRRQERAWMRPLLMFIGLALLLNAVLGDQGLIEGLRARRQMADARADLAALRRENRRLAEEARRLKEDPWAIEMIARQDLGLARPGEILVVVTRVKDGGTAVPPSRPHPAGR